MKNTLIASLVLAALFSVETQASDGLSYNYADINYTSYDIDGATVDGFEVEGSVSFGDNFFVSPSLVALTKSGVTLSLWRLDIGRSFSISDRIDLVASARLAYEDISSNGNSSFSGSGYGAVAGVRSMVSQRTELSGFVNWESWDKAASGTYLEARLRHSFSNNLYGRLSYKFEDSDATAIVVGVGYRF